MTETTPLDAAHAAMQAAPESETDRLRFYERLADGELMLLLATEAEGDSVTPRIFDLGEEGRFVLVFDREERLSAFTEGPAPYAALPGRALAGMLAGQGIGMGVNLEVAPSSILLPAQAVDWLAATLAQAPARIAARPDELHPPRGLPETVLSALDARLARAAGLARMALLAGVTYADGARGHMLAFVGAAPGAEPALARAVGEALTFSGVEAGALDVAFFGPEEPIVARLERCALRFDLPEPETPTRVAPVVPGSDPDKPPRLR
ncbi:MAG: SseB family protein [Paracoccaceae bacterium]